MDYVAKYIEYNSGTLLNYKVNYCTKFLNILDNLRRINYFTEKQINIFKKYIEGVSQIDIAKEFKITQPTVSRHIHTVYTRLNPLIDAFYPELIFKDCEPNV